MLGSGAATDGGCYVFCCIGFFCWNQQSILLQPAAAELEPARFILFLTFGEGAFLLELWYIFAGTFFGFCYYKRNPFSLLKLFLMNTVVEAGFGGELRRQRRGLLQPRCPHVGTSRRRAANGRSWIFAGNRAVVPTAARREASGRQHGGTCGGAATGIQGKAVAHARCCNRKKREGGWRGRRLRSRPLSFFSVWEVDEGGEGGLIWLFFRERGLIWRYGCTDRTALGRPAESFGRRAGAYHWPLEIPEPSFPKPRHFSPSSNTVPLAADLGLHRLSRDGTCWAWVPSRCRRQVSCRRFGSSLLLRYNPPKHTNGWDRSVPLHKKG